MKANKKRILVIRLSAMGDVALTVPVLYSIREQYPDIELYVFTNEAFAPFFTNINGLKVIGVKLSDYKGLNGLYRLYKNLKKYEIDWVADLHNVIRSKIIRFLFRMSGVKNGVIDKGRKEKKQLTRKNNKVKIQLKTSVERYADVFRKAGFNIQLRFKSIYPDGIPALSDKVIKLTGSETSEKLVGIAPFAKHKAKILPLAKMEEIINYLDKKNIRMFLFGGGEEEKTTLASWAAKYSNCTSVVGLLNLSEELQLINKLTVMLTMDSGNMHLSSLVNTPVISVWGATHPYAGFYGWGQNPDDIVQTDLFCRPCSVYGNKDCYRHDYACLNNLTTDMIIEKLESYIGK